MKATVQIVLVLYKTYLKDSLSYRSIKELVTSTSINYDLIVYNNSDEVLIEKSSEYELVNSSGNDMLAGAYNYALNKATREGNDWLLLLDQDTRLTKEYFDELESFLNAEDSQQYAAAVPVLFKSQYHLSPISYSRYIGPFIFFKPIDSTDTTSNKCVSGFNSAALISVDFMNSIGGFSTDYPLDMLDHWYFYQIHKAGKPVKILKARLEQNLSLLEIDTAMSISRYEKYIKSLFQFAHELKTTSYFFLEITLFKSLISQLIRPKKRKFFRITLLAMLGITSQSNK